MTAYTHFIPLTARQRDALAKPPLTERVRAREHSPREASRPSWEREGAGRARSQLVERGHSNDADEVMQSKNTTAAWVMMRFYIATYAHATLPQGKEKGFS